MTAHYERVGEAMEQGKENTLSYCISCRTGMEEKAALLVREALSIETIAPVKVKREWRGKRWEQLNLALLPGYIFAFAKPDYDIGKVQRFPYIQSVLRYSDGTAPLLGMDRAFAMWLSLNNGVIGLSTAIKEGDRVKVVSGPLKELAGKISTVDKRKQIAKVAFTFCGSTKHFWLSFDYLK
jgi:transcriptional antiterminator NusG